MKNIFLSFIAVLCSVVASAQYQSAKGTLKNDLPTVYITEDLSVHFISPEPIQYVDISTHNVVGDLPVKNILRIKAIGDSIKDNHDFGLLSSNVAVVTVVGEKFMAQYNVEFVTHSDFSGLQSNIQILPEHMQSIDNPDVTMSETEMRTYSLEAIKRKRTYHSVSSKAYGMKAELNNIYTVGDFVFVDVSYYNNTNLKYDIDHIRFKIEDRKIAKATNVQSVEVEPSFTLYTNDAFKKRFRNVFVFKKFTFPNNKVLNIEMVEKQISGRLINLQIDYSDLLNADTL